MRHIITLVCLALILGLGACSDSTTPKADFALTGTVTDADGESVADAAVLLDYDFLEVLAVTADKPFTRIRIDLPDPAHVRMEIKDACGAEVLHVFDDDVVGGEVAMMWNGTDLEGLQVPEGAYAAHITVDDQPTFVHTMMLARNIGDEGGDFGQADDARVREFWRIDAVTDADGHFVLNRACWDFGRTDDHVDENGTPLGELVIAPRMRLWFYTEGALDGVAGPWLDVDPKRGAAVQIQLPVAR